MVSVLRAKFLIPTAIVAGGAGAVYYTCVNRKDIPPAEPQKPLPIAIPNSGMSEEERRQLRECEEIQRHLQERYGSTLTQLSDRSQSSHCFKVCVGANTLSSRDYNWNEFGVGNKQKIIDEIVASFDPVLQPPNSAEVRNLINGMRDEWASKPHLLYMLSRVDLRREFNILEDIVDRERLGQANAHLVVRLYIELANRADLIVETKFKPHEIRVCLRKLQTPQKEVITSELLQRDPEELLRYIREF